jgi:hypothetical protein
MDRAVRPQDLQDVCVVRVEPPDGSSGVLRDAPVLARVSHRVDARSLSADSVRIWGHAGLVSMRRELRRDGYVLICRPDRPLEAGVEHRLEVVGLRDSRGREVLAHESRFVPGGLGLHDLEEEAC